MGAWAIASLAGVTQLVDKKSASTQSLDLEELRSTRAGELMAAKVDGFSVFLRAWALSLRAHFLV
jgi:hypothetical protein